MDTSFDERRRCPKCEHLGSVKLVESRRDGKSYAARCENERCPWYNTEWVFDVNPDGSLPEVRPHRKQYRPLPGGDARTDEVRASIDAELERSKKRQ